MSRRPFVRKTLFLRPGQRHRVFQPRPLLLDGFFFAERAGCPLVLPVEWIPNPVSLDAYRRLFFPISLPGGPSSTAFLWPAALP